MPSHRRPQAEGARRTSAISARARSRIVDLHDITTGKAHYGADTRLPGMKYAVIARPPVTGGKLKSFDGSASDEGARRREGDGGQGLALAVQVPAARRRGRDRAQHRRRRSRDATR